MSYLGPESHPLRDPEGFVDTGDRVELRGQRYHFAGRSGGIINVGGLKVHPEEIEAVLNAHPWVHMSRAQGRRNPITGAVVIAEVVLTDEAPMKAQSEVELIAQMLQHCRGLLAPHKVPAKLRIVASLPVSPAGKLVRTDG
jgi:acyl-coenzyme A synthetase/AMP-(fatty) acid ligase